MKEYNYCPYCGEELKRNKDEDTVRDIFVWLWDEIDSFCLELGVNYNGTKCKYEVDPDCTKCKYGIAANALVGEYNCVTMLKTFKEEAERMIHNG